MLIVVGGESVRDYHDSVGQFDRGQIPPPSLAGKGVVGLGFPNSPTASYHPRTDLTFLGFYLSLLPKLAYMVREAAGNFLSPLFGKFIFGGRKHCFNRLLSLDRPWQPSFIGNSREK